MKAFKRWGRLKNVRNKDASLKLSPTDPKWKYHRKKATRAPPVAGLRSQLPSLPEASLPCQTVSGSIVHRPVQLSTLPASQRDHISINSLVHSPMSSPTSRFKLNSQYGEISPQMLSGFMRSSYERHSVIHRVSSSGNTSDQLVKCTIDILKWYSDEKPDDWEGFEALKSTFTKLHVSRFINDGYNGQSVLELALALKLLFTCAPHHATFVQLLSTFIDVFQLHMLRSSYSLSSSDVLMLIGCIVIESKAKAFENQMGRLPSLVPYLIGYPDFLEIYRTVDGCVLKTAGRNLVKVLLYHLEPYEILRLLRRVATAAAVGLKVKIQNRTEVPFTIPEWYSVSGYFFRRLASQMAKRGMIGSNEFLEFSDPQTYASASADHQDNLPGAHLHQIVLPAKDEFENEPIFILND